MPTMTQRQKINAWGYNTIAKQILSPVILGIILFALAGTTDWFWGWVFNILHLIVWAGMTLALIRWNPELLNARGKRGAGTKRWDVVLLGIYGIAWIAMVAGFALTTWGMVVNRNFEVTVRLQEDRDHQVITTGPYQIVRHPGYTGVIMSFFIGMPLVLNSLPAFIPALVGAAVMIVRTRMEDRTLQAELPGYAEFTQQTRYRLLPGVW